MWAKVLIKYYFVLFFRQAKIFKIGHRSGTKLHRIRNIRKVCFSILSQNRHYHDIEYRPHPPPYHHHPHHPHLPHPHHNLHHNHHHYFPHHHHYLEHCMRSRWSVFLSLVSCYTTDSPWLWPSIHLGLSWSNLLFVFWEEKKWTVRFTAPLPMSLAGASSSNLDQGWSKHLGGDI